MKRNTGPPGDGGNKKSPRAGGLLDDTTTGRVECQNLYFYSTTCCQPKQQPCLDRFNRPLSLLIDTAIQEIELCHEAAKTADNLAEFYANEAVFWRNRAAATADVKRLFEAAIPQRVQQTHNSVKDISPTKDGPQ